jgi:hypothetical protein
LSSPKSGIGIGRIQNIPTGIAFVRVRLLTNCPSNWQIHWHQFDPTYCIPQNLKITLVVKKSHLHQMLMSRAKAPARAVKTIKAVTAALFCFPQPLTHPQTLAANKSAARKKTTTKTHNPLAALIRVSMLGPFLWLDMVRMDTPKHDEDRLFRITRSLSHTKVECQVVPLIHVVQHQSIESCL